MEELLPPVDGPGHGGAGARRSPRRPLAWLLLGVLLLALFTALLFHTGYYASDDLGQYVAGATELAESGRMTRITMGTKRLGIVFPLALVAFLTDHNAYFMTAFFSLFQVLIVAGVFVVGRLTHGSATGLVAAFLMAVCPLAAAYAAMVLPDHAATGLMLVALALMIEGVQTSDQARTLRSLWIVALSGLVFGASMTAKDTAIMMLPPFVLFLAARVLHSSTKRIASLAGAFFVGLAVASAFYFLSFRAATGLWSPLEDPHFSERFYSFADRASALPYGGLESRLAKLIDFATSTRYLGLFFKGAMPLALLAYPFTKRRSWLVYLSFLWLCFYMTYGTFSLTRYAPPPMQTRYFVFALPFAALILGHVAVELGRFLWGRLSGRLPSHPARRRLAVASVAILSSVWAAEAYHRLNHLAGSLYYAPEVSATRYALDFASASGRLPVVLSRWLSGRVGRAIPPEAPVVLTDISTRLEDVAHLIGPNGLTYLDWEGERRPSYASPSTPSPLDRLLRRALAEPFGRVDTASYGSVEVRTLGAFSQFRTRFAALAYVFAGSADLTMMPRHDSRRVFLRQVVFVPEELDPEDAILYDFSGEEAIQSTWVHRVDDWTLRVTPSGGLFAQVTGSADTTAGQYAGVLMEIGPVRAFRLDVELHNPDELDRMFLDLTAGPGRHDRVRWVSIPGTVLAKGRRSYLFSFDRPTPGFIYQGGPADPEQLDHAHFFVRLRGLNARAGFHIRRLLIWPRAVRSEAERTEGITATDLRRTRPVLGQTPEVG